MKHEYTHSGENICGQTCQETAKDERLLLK